MVGGGEWVEHFEWGGFARNSGGMQDFEADGNLRTEEYFPIFKEHTRNIP